MIGLIFQILLFIGCLLLIVGASIGLIFEFDLVKWGRKYGLALDEPGLFILMFVGGIGLVVSVWMVF